MTRSEEKLITFKDLLNLVTHQIKIYLSHPDPEMQALIHHFPRIISNTVFDNTSNQEFCLQKVYHRNGKYLRKASINGRIDFLNPYIKETKKAIRNLSFKKWKGQYYQDVQLLKLKLEGAQNELKSLKEERSKIGALDFMHEHVTGLSKNKKYAKI